MMISPENFYETELKGKTAEEVIKVIKREEREIEMLKKIAKTNNGANLTCPTPDTQIYWKRQYINRAIIMFKEELHTEYAPTNAKNVYLEVAKKIKADVLKLESGTWFVVSDYLQKYGVTEWEEMFDVYYEVERLLKRQTCTPTEFFGCDSGVPFNVPLIRIKGLKSITLDVHGIFGPNDVYMAQLEGESVVISHFDNFAFDFAQPFKTIKVPQAEFLKTFKDLYIEKWEREYVDPHVLDGTQWELTLEYSYKRIKIYGSNAYPDNWEELLELLNVNFDKD